MPAQEPFVIVGGGLAGAKAAETLRAEGFDGQVVLVGAEPEQPYERPPLSKGYLLGTAPRDGALVHDKDWYAQNGVDLRTGIRVTRLDVAAHRLGLETGEELGYAKLLLATGADLDGVRYLRTLADADRLLADLTGGGRRVVIVGAGWIGLEVAAAARHHGNAVTVVEPQQTPLHAVLGSEMGSVFARLHRHHGVDLFTGTTVREFRGADGRVTAVVTDRHAGLTADVVVVGIGAVPNVELAAAAGLEVDNGVVADHALRTSAPDVVAAGDVVSAFHPLYGRYVRVEHWANALNQGPAAARSMLGQDITYDRVPYFYTDQYDLGMEYSGWVPPGRTNDVVVRGDLAKREFIAFWVSHGRVLAGMNVNTWDVTDPIQQLVRSGLAGRTVDPTRLADPAVPLDDLVH
jgi:NADPH-dependent 2,4-dienoyl-CoA reductase/sulfur reductase-like enzyme